MPNMSNIFQISHGLDQILMPAAKTQVQNIKSPEKSVYFYQEKLWKSGAV